MSTKTSPNIPDKKAISSDIEPFLKTDEKAGSSRAELLDEFDTLLSTHQLDNKISRKYLSRERMPKTLLAVAGVLMCIAAVVLILTPAVSLGNTTKYVTSACLGVAGVYLAVRFSL
ncbi:MAG TPA: hypothetical protein VHC47_12345 [Mucilaginibacter sp.]|nr:hypothetical protein [Mucilaginibacter sp.]